MEFVNEDVIFHKKNADCPPKYLVFAYLTCVSSLLRKM